MKYLQRAWVRIIASLLLAGAVQEIIAINSANPNQREAAGSSSPLFLISVVVIYFILTAIIKNYPGK